MNIREHELRNLDGVSIICAERSRTFHFSGPAGRQPGTSAREIRHREIHVEDQVAFDALSERMLSFNLGRH